MRYKTMALELLQDRPRLHRRLSQNRMLLATVNLLAAELKLRHEAWKEQLAKARPESAPEQLASEALELALEGLQALLPPASPADGSEELSLDEAMAFLRRHTPPA